MSSKKIAVRRRNAGADRSFRLSAIYCLLPAVCWLSSPALAQRTVYQLPAAGDTLYFKADVCLWGRAHALQETDYMPWTPATRSENSFDRAIGYTGVSLQFGQYLQSRVMFDVGDITGRPIHDLFAAASWRGLDLRVGQFKPPTGYENLTAHWRVDFVDGTMLSGLRTPTGMTRDIGAQLAYNHEWFQTALAVLNGNGRNQPKDNNRFKDVAYRLIATPLGNTSPLFLGGNLYLGSDTLARDTANEPFRRFAGEFGWVNPGYFVRAEFMKGSDAAGGVNGMYVAAGFRVRDIQPVVRFERVVAERPNLAVSVLTIGLNGFFVQDRVKPMLDFSWASDKVKEIETFKLALQLQVAFW